MIVAFIDECRRDGFAVESVCRVLSEQGCQVAARTYRAWARAGQRVAGRTVSDAVVMDTVREAAWTVDEHGPMAGVRRPTPEGLYGRRKMTALIQRRMPQASPGSADRAMKAPGLKGIRRSKGVRTTIPGKDGKRAGDLLNRDVTACAPNRTWVMDFTYCRTWAGFVYVSFVVDVFARRIVAWHAATCKDVDLVMAPLRMATWQRQREGHPIERDVLIGHADAGRQGGFNVSSQHLVFSEVFDSGDGGLEQEDRRCSRGCASAVACRRRRYGRRCVRPGGLIPPGRCSGTSGVRSRRVSPRPRRR